MKTSYSILINTCDKFEDCWNPFFKLWSIYWPGCKGKIYLNTEYKNYQYGKLNINSLKVCEEHCIPQSYITTWSKCLGWALEKIDSDIILYLQEDYFFKAPVKNDVIEGYVDLMNNNKKISCIHLTDQAVQHSEKSEFEYLDNITYHQRYRVSCQAALWRKSELLNLIREYEDAWEFEEFGSMRSAVLRHDYYVVCKKYVELNRFEIIPYIFTGIVQGRWNEEVVTLFQKHNIDIDFSKRGFVKDTPVKPFIKRVKYRINKISKIFRNRIEMSKIYFIVK